MCHPVRIVMFKPMAPPCLGLKGGQKEWKDYHIRVSDTADAFRANAERNFLTRAGSILIHGNREPINLHFVGQRIMRK